MDSIQFIGLNSANDMKQETSSCLIDINNLSLRIKGVELLNNFDLCICGSYRIGITGPSGCGKTTLLRSIVRSSPPEGSIFNKFVISLNSKERIGYAPQSGGLLPWYSLRRNLINVVAGKTTKNVEDANVDEITEAFALSKQLDQYPSMLSGGEKQRSILAASIVLKPRVFVTDEPLTEVDLAGKWKLLQYWSSKIAEFESALVLVSHDVDVLLYLCDEIIVLTGKPSQISCRFFITAPHPRQREDMTIGKAHEVRKALMSGFIF